MAGEIEITIVGNLTSDPELKYLPSGAAVANVTVANNPRYFDRQAGEWKDGTPSFHRCNIWKQLAEHTSETLTRGMRVIVHGHVRQRTFDTKESEKRTVQEIEVDAIGPDLRYATAKVTKSTTRSQAAASDGGPWDAVPAGAAAGDEPPF